MGRTAPFPPHSTLFIFLDGEDSSAVVSPLEEGEATVLGTFLFFEATVFLHWGDAEQLV